MHPSTAAILGRRQAAVVYHCARSHTVTLIELNREAYEEFNIKKHLAIVPGATYLFEEPGALQEVARLASGVVCTHLGRKKDN